MTRNPDDMLRALNQQAALCADTKAGYVLRGDGTILDVKRKRVIEQCPEDYAEAQRVYLAHRHRPAIQDMLGEWINEHLSRRVRDHGPLGQLRYMVSQLCTDYIATTTLCDVASPQRIYRSTGSGGKPWEVRLSRSPILIAEYRIVAPENVPLRWRRAMGLEIPETASREEARHDVKLMQRVRWPFRINPGEAAFLEVSAVSNEPDIIEFSDGTQELWIQFPVTAVPSVIAALNRACEYLKGSPELVVEKIREIEIAE